MKRYLLIVAPIIAGLIGACTVTPSTENSSVITYPISLPTPVVINVQTDGNNKDEKKDTKDKQKDDAVHVCTLSAFTSQYRSENTSRGKARLNVKKQCLAQFNEMFCRDQDIKCTEYN